MGAVLAKRATIQFHYCSELVAAWLAHAMRNTVQNAGLAAEEPQQVDGVGGIRIQPSGEHVIGVLAGRAYCVDALVAFDRYAEQWAVAPYDFKALLQHRVIAPVVADHCSRATRAREARELAAFLRHQSSGLFDE